MGIGVVPRRALALGNAHVLSASPVQATDWAAASSAYDLLDGMGSALIPMCASMGAISGTTPTDLDGMSLTFTVWPRYQCTHRLWLFALGFPFATSLAYGFQDPSGGQVFGNASDVSLISHVETVSARTSSETQLTTLFATDNDAGLTAIGCYELPRVSLAVAGSSLATTDAGMNAAVVNSGRPIDDDYAGNGIGFVARELDALRDSCRRTGLFAAAPFASTTSGTFTTVLTAPVVLGRSLYNGQTQSIMQLALNATVSGASAQGECRVTMASGAVVTIGISSSGNFRSQIAIDCEDLTSSDGRRGSRDETVTVELRRTSASGSITLNTINGGEGTPATVAALLPQTLAKRPRFRRHLPHWMTPKRRTR
jgi:hypothetical protein